MATFTTLSILNDHGNLFFDSDADYSSSAKSYNIGSSNGDYSLTIGNNIDIKTTNGYLKQTAVFGAININSSGNLSNAVIISASNVNGGILQTAGTAGFNVTTTNGNINLLSRGADIDIGVSPIGTPQNLQTQNINIECFDNYNVNSADMYFVSSNVISFVSATGDIQFGTSPSSAPVLKFENGNVLINQSTSNLDYQLDIAVTDSSTSKDSYNGIIVNSKLSNVAAEITLQTSNTIGDGTQCSISMGSYGLNNNRAIYKPYLAYQIGNVVFRLDGPSFSPHTEDEGFGKDFIYSDIGRQIYWTTTDRLDTITGLSSYVTTTNDTSNVVISGTYSGNVSSVYLLQIDSIGTPNTFKWSNNGGTSFQQIYVPIINTVTPIQLDNGLYALFSITSGFSINQQFTFQTKITAIVSNSTSILIPETMNSLQPFHSYIETTTPSDIVIKTNSNEKMRITGDGAVTIQQNAPTASLDLNCNYNKVILVNQSLTGYQINPAISYLSSGGYVIVWNSQDSIGNVYNFNVIGQRYMADGSQYGSNFQINNTTGLNQSFPSVAGNKLQNSNHYIVAWSSNNNIYNLYKIYCQIYQNNNAISLTDIQVDAASAPSTSVQLNPRVAGLYNGKYLITWSASDSNNGIYSVYAIIVTVNPNNTVTFSAKITVATNPTYSRQYPYVAGFPDDDTYYPNGFVIGYMSAIDANADPRYTIAISTFNSLGQSIASEIPITTAGDPTYSNISDGLLSIAEINTNNVNGTNGGFVLSFYRSYQADTTLYSDGDIVVGVLSGATSTILSRNPATRTLSLEDVSSRFLISEEIQIGYNNNFEKVGNVVFTSNTTADITLSTGSKNVVAYRFNSNVTNVSNALWNIQVNTSTLYNDLDRFNGNPAVYVYKRPMAVVTVDNKGIALVTWSNGSIPSVYYQLIDTSTGTLIDTEQIINTIYNGLKQRDQVVTHLQSIGGNDYGFVISWDNQSLNLQNTGIYQQLIGYNHSIINFEDGNSSIIFNHQNQLGIGTDNPLSTLHIKSVISNMLNDTANPSTITIQNTSKHVITNQDLQTIQFIDGSNNILNKIQSINSLRYDDLYPQPVNLIGFYKFDQTQGTQVIDYSGSSTFYATNDTPVYVNTNGILNNFDIENCWVSGIINNSLLFNGVNNYVFVESTSLNKINTVLETGSNTLSLSCWINVPSVIVNSASYDIISNGGNLSLPGTYLLNLTDIGSNGSMVITSNIVCHSPSNVNNIVNAGLRGNTKLNDSNWHHIVETVSVNNSVCNVSIYVDGILEKSLSTAGSITATLHGATKTYFGSRNAVSNFYRGNLDELRIYNSILSTSEITQLYTYGNPNVPPKASLILSPNSTATHNQAIVIDDDGKINNLSSRPLPYTILSGELVAYNTNKNITGVGTNFINELTIGDIIVLGSTQDTEFTVITIVNNFLITINKKGYAGEEASKSYQSVLRKPSIYSFFDNSDSIRGHIDNYGNMMIGGSKPTTMLEISGLTSNTNNLPELTLTNLEQENTQFGRKTAVNFSGYDATNVLNTPVKLGSIEVSHNGTNSDNKGIMVFNVSNVSVQQNVMSLTSDGYIGIGNQNLPETLIHAYSENTAKECALTLESKYNITTNPSVFDERSDVYFRGVTSKNDNTNPNIRYNVLSAISGSKDTNINSLLGRLDLLTNNNDTTTQNGIESRMSITHTGYVGVNILQPANMFNVAPEKRAVSSVYTKINSINNVGGTLITLSQGLFDTPELQLMFVGGSLVINNETLTRANIIAVNANNQITVDVNLTAYVNYNVYVHYAGLNVSATNGYTGVNTISPGSVLSVNGSLSLPITTTSTDITLNTKNYTVICNTNSGAVIVTLPSNNTGLLGRIYVIKKYGTNTCSINPNGSTIDGSGSNYSVTTIVKVQSDGTNWWVIS